MEIKICFYELKIEESKDRSEVWPRNGRPRFSLEKRMEEKENAGNTIYLSEWR